MIKIVSEEPFQEKRFRKVVSEIRMFWVCDFLKLLFSKRFF
jgi:hypothetical protein